LVVTHSRTNGLTELSFYLASIVTLLTRVTKRREVLMMFAVAVLDEE
jgi:hypothetical protein